MGNDTADCGSNKKSHLHSSTESVEDMDTSNSTASPHKMPHTNKDGCPSCSGLCSRRGPQRSPPGHSYAGVGTDLSVDRLSNDYAGAKKVYRGDYGSGGSSSYQFTNTDNYSPCSSGSASGTTYTHRGVAPPLGTVESYRLGGAVNTRDTVSDPGRPFINSFGSFGIDTTVPFKSSYEAGYEEGLRVGYELAMAEFSAPSVHAANGNGSQGKGLLALENGDESGGDDIGFVAGGDNIIVGHQLHHNQNNSNFNSITREKDLSTNNTDQAGQSNVRSAADGERGLDTKADRVTKPHNCEGAGGNLASSFPSHTYRQDETGGNVLGMTKADEADILNNAAKVVEWSNASSPTHSDRNATKFSYSVLPKSRSTSCNGSSAWKEKSPLAFISKFTVKGSTRSFNENVNVRNGSKKGMSDVNPSLEGFGAASSQRQNKFRKKPASQQEKLLADFTTEGFHQPRASRVASTRGSSASTSSWSNTAAGPPDCSICMTSLAEDSPYLKTQDVSRDLVGCAALKLCGHHFHISCLMQMATHDASWLACPNCQTIHGVRIGTQPKTGTFNYRKYGGNLPGFPRSSGTIEITYSFRHGKQGPEHPNPGRPYHLVGFPRVAYLPDTPQGNKVLKLLRVAFERRLIFTVGISATSGSADCVVWNGIHHKTETHDSSGHGYPDPKYLDNVTMELASFGVT